MFCPFLGFFRGRPSFRNIIQLRISHLRLCASRLRDIWSGEGEFQETLRFILCLLAPRPCAETHPRWVQNRQTRAL
jgi:hypothetical protein